VLEGGAERGFAKHCFAPPEPARLARRAVFRSISKPILPLFGSEAAVMGKGYRSSELRFMQ